ncbi:MAG: 50S ribosomal protein L27 [Caldisericia bacterium]|nr:50S ribosomal protein L27 [Caldisericia bacterium]
MAHKKAGGSATNGRDSNPKYLGVKVADGQCIDAGGIIVRQRGTRIYPGIGADLGRDHTIYATVPGIVRFRRFGKTGKKVDIDPIQ